MDVALKTLCGKSSVWYIDMYIGRRDTQLQVSKYPQDLRPLSGPPAVISR